MKKLFKILLSLIVLYFVLKLGIKHFGNGHNISYKIDKFNIEEKLSINNKDEIDNYYIKINSKKFNIELQILSNLKKDKKILKEIKYETFNNQTCILPIFKDNQILTDILCVNNNIINNYSSLKGTNHELDNFANRMKEYGYNFKKYENNLKKYTKSKTLKLFTNNIVNNHFIALNDYRGIKTISNGNNYNSFNLFKKDIYNVSLAYGLKNKYIIFDYNNKYEFDKLYVIDIVKNKKEVIKLKNKISHNSKIIGTNDNSILLIDYDNKKEYEINIKKNNIKEIGNKDNGYITYNCGKKENIESNKILNKDYLIFKCYQNKKDDKYERIDLAGSSNSGYYYYYQKTVDGYKVYRSNVQNPKQKLYITTLDNIDNINYSKEYIYYIKDNQINYYSDYTGIRTLMENTEFEFNKSLNYHVYVKES